MFGSDTDRIRALFASEDLDELVWSAPVDSLAPADADVVDVVVRSDFERAQFSTAADTYTIGLAYWPGGPVVRGVQKHAAGSTVNFANVPVKRGGTLALFASKGWTQNSLRPTVFVEPAGGGGAKAKEEEKTDPVTKGLMVGAAIAVVLVVIVILK